MTKKVLIVDDSIQWQKIWGEMLGGKIEVISAYSIKEARGKFADNPDVDAIVMDACVPGDEPTTPPLVIEFRKTYKGPIVAISSLPEYQKILMHVGCDHSADKNTMPEYLLNFLGL